jgi:hypothetical protein
MRTRQAITFATVTLLVLGAALAVSAQPAANPGECPAGYDKINYSGSLTWTSDDDYDVVILVGGPPSGGTEPRDITYTDVEEGDVLARQVYEISHICTFNGNGGDTTTSTTQPEEETTTTTVEDTTTTTVQETTTTIVEVDDTTTTTTEATTTTTDPGDPTTTSTEPEITTNTLPYTGAGTAPLIVSALAMLGLGAALVRRT